MRSSRYSEDLALAVVAFISSSIGYIWSTYSPSCRLFGERISSIQRNVKLKDHARFFHFSREALHKICFIRIKEQFREKGNTFTTHRNADCLLKITCTNWYNKFVVNQKLNILMMYSVSYNSMVKSVFCLLNFALFLLFLFICLVFFCLFCLVFILVIFSLFFFVFVYLFGVVFL